MVKNCHAKNDGHGFIRQRQSVRRADQQIDSVASVNFKTRFSQGEQFGRYIKGDNPCSAISEYDRIHAVAATVFQDDPILNLAEEMKRVFQGKTVVSDGVR